MKTQSGKIRIIGGRFKGRHLQFPAVSGLRPTPERIRETLFNWLAPHISGCHCLDLFAGSGALGFEALSRGAGHITFVESSRIAVRAIVKNTQILNLNDASVVDEDSIRYLKRCRSTFDIIFIDPPFKSSLLQSSLGLICQHGLISKSGWIYAEYSVHQPQPDCPAHWVIHRQTRAGDVKACLIQTNQLAGTT